MKPPSIPDVLAGDEPYIADALPARPKRRRRRTSAGRALVQGMRTLAGWSWRLLIGVLFCTTYFSSVIVTGWTYRWLQGFVLRGWWKASHFASQGTFAEFCSPLQPDAPVTQPRWFWMEYPAATVRRPTADGRAPSTFRQGLRALRVPWDSLWSNFKVGVQALLCTFLVTGPGCALMVFSWEFGWLNSFNKGYELAAVGPVTGIAGVVLFMAAMFYVPMAQVHQAVTGDARAFFHFRFVWRLIQARPLTFAGLAALTLLVSVPLEVLRAAPKFFDGNLWSEDASDEQVLRILRVYRLGCAAVLFGSLLLVRLLAALNYRAAVLEVLRRGWIERQELHPFLETWLDHLGLLPPHSTVQQPAEWGTGSLVWWSFGALNVVLTVATLVALFAAGPLAGLIALVVWGLTWLVAGGLYLSLIGKPRQFLRFVVWQLSFGLLFWIWFLFVAKVYVGEFINYHPIGGFLNHSLVQLPCLDPVPNQLASPPAP